MMSIDTTKGAAIIAALIVAGLVFVSSILTQYFLNDRIYWWLDIGLFAVTGLICYFVVQFIISRFVYDRIKVIYRTIHKFNNSPAPKSGMADEVISQVNTDVMLWAQEKIDTINKLQETDTFRKEFIGNLSHELKTPIFNIQGYIDTLLEGALEDEKNNRMFLAKAATNVDRVTNLLSDLDEISKIEISGIELDNTQFSVSDLVLDVFDSLQRIAKKQSVELAISNSNSREFLVMADRKRIEQVLINLIKNAIYYGNAGGQIMVGFFDMDDRLLVEVSDNGIGISKEDQFRIFERFYRVEKSRSRNKGGSGLGLAIVKHIIEAHGQTVDVRSKLGKGSTFSFTLKKP